MLLPIQRSTFGPCPTILLLWTTKTLSWDDKLSPKYYVLPSVMRSIGRVSTFTHPSYEYSTTVVVVMDDAYNFYVLMKPLNLRGG